MMRRRRPDTKILSGVVVAAVLLLGATASVAQGISAAGRLVIVDPAGTGVIGKVLQQIGVSAALSVSARPNRRTAADTAVNTGLTGADYVASIHRTSDSGLIGSSPDVPTDSSTQRGKQGNNLVLAQFN